MPLTPRQIERTFEAIVAAAVAGERCPQEYREGHPGLPSGATTKLVQAGRVKIEVCGKNWRVAEILEGPHTGKRTQAPPFPNSGPYLVRDASGSVRMDHIRREVAKRQGQPSASRTLKREELER